MATKISPNKNQWLILSILIGAFVPVVIDATVLHMAIPSLTIELKASGNSVLWILDIYSLVMAGLLLPMGVLGDKIGHKNLLFYGVIIFTIASLCAGFSQISLHLIFSRILLAIGGAMIMPSTLAIIRQTFQDDRQRGIALGIWVIFANGGAAVGPLLGGILIDYFSWRAVFLINIPFLLIIIPLVKFILPKGISAPHKQWIIKDAIVLLMGIISVVYCIKTLSQNNSSSWIGIIIGIIGFILLFFFYSQQKNSSHPMLDKTLFQSTKVRLGMLFTFIPMMVTSGFELLLSQELQFIHQLTPTQTAFYIAPFFLAFALSGAMGGIIKIIGVFPMKIMGLTFSAISFLVLSQSDFSILSINLIFWLILLGFGLGVIMLAASYSIMSAANDNNAGTAGSLESIAYELGVGLGVTFFGVLLSQVFSRKLQLSNELAPSIPENTYYSINDAMLVAENMGGTTGEAIKNATFPAFESAHSVVLATSGIVLLLFAILLTYKFLKEKFIVKLSH